MPYILTDFETAVASRIQDAANKLSLADRDDAISQAVRQRYSKDRPRELASDVTADGTSQLPLPQGPSTPAEQFEDGFSAIRSLEFPIGTLPPTLLESNGWQLYRTPTGLKILLSDTTVPSNGDHVRVTWTVRHIPGTSGGSPINTTIPDADFEAVSDMASAICCEKLAAIYAQTRDPSIQADAVNYRTKSQEYLALAKALRQRYFEHVGIEGGGSGASEGSSQPGALAIGDMDLMQGSGVDRLTHRRPR
jgi:hypothetical protein